MSEDLEGSEVESVHSKDDSASGSHQAKTAGAKGKQRTKRESLGTCVVFVKSVEIGGNADLDMEWDSSAKLEVSLG